MRFLAVLRPSYGTVQGQTLNVGAEIGTPQTGQCTQLITGGCSPTYKRVLYAIVLRQRQNITAYVQPFALSYRND